MDRAQLADFVRTRRKGLQPEDVGLPRGPRRRTDGLRREEIAALSGISTDYYSRIEQLRGPHPSEQMLAALARGLRLSLDERDHLLVLGGYAVPQRSRRGDHVGAQGLVDALSARSEEFARVWADHEVGRRHSKVKHLVHPEVGELEVYCQVLHDPDQSQGLLVFTAVPGSTSYERLHLLSVLGPVVGGSQ